MRPFVRYVVVFLAVLAGRSNLQAQPATVPARLSLADALALAELQSPRLLDARAGVRLAESAVTAARARPNPVITVASEDYPLFEPNRPSFFGHQETTVRADIEIETAGRRGLRSRVAEVGLEGARAAYAHERRALRLTVARRYLETALAEADLSTARAVLGDIDRMLAINRARFEQGELAGVEFRRLQVERQRFADDVFAAELASRNARAALLSVLGAPALDQPFEVSDTLESAGPPVSSSAGQPAAMLTGERWDLKAARLDVDRARAGVRVEQAQRTPTLTVGGGWKRIFGSDAVVFEVAVPVPLFDRNAAGLQRADADLARSAARASAIESEAALDTQIARNALDVAQRRVASVESGYVKNAREARDIVLAAYRAGATTLLDYLDAERMVREALRAANRARFDVRLAGYQLQAALGIDIGGGINTEVRQ